MDVRKEKRERGGTEGRGGGHYVTAPTNRSNKQHPRNSAENRLTSILRESFCILHACTYSLLLGDEA